MQFLLSFEYNQIKCPVIVLCKLMICLGIAAQVKRKRYDRFGQCWKYGTLIVKVHRWVILLLYNFKSVISFCVPTYLFICLVFHEFDSAMSVAHSQASRLFDTVPVYSIPQ